MVKILCQMTDCINWEDGLCSAEQIKVSGESYCLTYEEVSNTKEEHGDWDEDDKALDDEWEDEDEWEEEEEEDEWDDDEEDL